MKTLLLGAALLLAACASDPVPPSGDTLAVGTWGGPDAGVIVTEPGAHVHIGCTNGDIPGPVPLSADGSFDVAGSYLLKAYPVAMGPTMPARFTGRVEGRTLTFSVTVTDTIEHRTVVLGPAEVKFGRDPQMPNCPICTMPEMETK